MKAISAALVVLASVLAPDAFTAANASAPITIEATRVGPAGTFELSGALADAGTFTVGAPVFGGPGPGHFVIVHATETFTGTEGAFTIVRNLRVTWGADPTVRAIAGTWTVIDGTGGYEDLHAHGTISGTVQGVPPAETFDLVYSGVS